MNYEENSKLYDDRNIAVVVFVDWMCSPEPQTGKKMSMYYINTAETKVEVHEQYLNTKTLDEQLLSLIHI